MRRAAKVDDNHARIVTVLRQVGAHVISVSGLPGALDILVAYRGTLTLMEIKDGAKKPSDRKLTAKEQQTIAALAACGVVAPVVFDEDDALRAIGAL